VGYDISRIPTEGWKTVRLPYKQQHVDHNSLWFQTQISIPDEQCRYYLKISGLQCDAIVFVDDQRVGEMKGSEARIDITSAVAPGNDATVSLWVTRWWEGTTLTFETDYMRRATLTSSELARLVSSDPEEIRRRVVLGISEGVWLEARPLLAEIENVFVATSYRNSELTLFVDAISHEDLTGAKFEIRVTELDGTSNGLPSGVFPVSSVGEGPLSQHTITIPWKDPQLWDIGSPYLYYVNVSLLDSNDNVIHEYPPVRFGFREIWTEGKELILNGHPLHLKIAPFVHSIPAMLFFEGIGFNAMLVQPNSDYWFGVKGHGLFPDSTTVRQASNQELLDAADERGWAVLMSAPTFKYSEMEFFMPEAQTQYMEYFKMWMRKLDRQNRPSILTWTPTVNTGINYDPDRLGKIDPSQSSTRGLVHREGTRLIKEVDPTRLVYHHQGAGASELGGQVGDIEASNIYPNHMPLQELEDFLEEWSKNGQRPWGSVEYGAIWETDLFNNGRLIPQFTEYSARYFGDEAYEAEKDEYVKVSLDVVKNPPGDWRSGEKHLGMKGFQLAGAIHHLVDWTAFGRLVDLVVTNNYRSWRGFGLNFGTFPWINYGFGMPPNWRKPTAAGTMTYTYDELRRLPDWENLYLRPDWANGVYDTYAKAMAPLMVYIGGPVEKITAKDHNYVSGETVEKTIVAIWDGIGKRKFRVEWQLVVDGKVLDSGNEFFTMGVGAIEKRLIGFTVPRVDVRTDARLSITVYDAETKVRLTDDSFDMAFFPGFDRVEDLKSRWGIYDPFGRTAPELAKIGFEAVPVEMGDSLEDIDVLIIGHRAVTVTGELPFTAQQVEDGLNVVFFEQGLHGLEALGMRGQDIIPRYTFPRVKDHPILANLEPEDLINWRGSGTLLPERSKGMRQWETRRPPHVGNYGSVASVVIETPHQGAFTPIVECEFDLAYSPLVSWKHGKGEVIFSQFDITDRLDVEPVASILAANIIRYADDKSVTASQDGRIVFLQDTGSNEEDIEFINKLGLECVVAGELGSLEVSDVVVIGRDGIGAITANLERLEEHIRAGGAVVVLPQKEDIMNAADLPWDVQVREERLSKALLSASDEGDSVLRGIGPQLVHWRTFLDLAVFTKVPSEGRSLLEGLVLVIDEGTNGGQWIFSQIDWTGLYDKSSLDMIDHLTRPRWNTIKLYRQLFANLGVRSSSETTTSLLGIVKKTYKSAELRERYYGGRLYEEPLDAVKDPYEFFAW